MADFEVSKWPEIIPIFDDTQAKNYANWKKLALLVITKTKGFENYGPNSSAAIHALFNILFSKFIVEPTANAFWVTAADDGFRFAVLDAWFLSADLLKKKENDAINFSQLPSMNLLEYVSTKMALLKSAFPNFGDPDVIREVLSPGKILQSHRDKIGYGIIPDIISLMRIAREISTNEAFSIGKSSLVVSIDDLSAQMQEIKKDNVELVAFMKKGKERATERSGDKKNLLSTDCSSDENLCRRCRKIPPTNGFTMCKACFIEAKKNFSCSKCKKKGHFKKDCPLNSNLTPNNGLYAITDLSGSAFDGSGDCTDSFGQEIFGLESDVLPSF